MVVDFQIHKVGNSGFVVCPVELFLLTYAMRWNGAKVIGRGRFGRLNVRSLKKLEMSSVGN